MARPRRPPRPDADAGGEAGLLEAKAGLRDEVWEALRSAGVARFPGARGRIPNFTGAEAAAERLRACPAWQRARCVKVNPDAPQWPVRQRALEDGKLLVMAVPRLAEDPPFLLLDPERLAGSPRSASSIKGMAASAVRVGLDDLPAFDLVVSGCVAAGADGARLGKGGGFADLELALATAAGLVGPRTVVATTVHDLQVRPPGAVPTTGHDVPLDLVVTPTRTLEVAREGRRPRARVRWDELTDDKVAAMPLLARLRDGAPGPGGGG